MSNPAIRVENLSKRFGKRAVVDGLSFEVPVGGVCGFLGRNGSGKTTTLRMLMNLIDPSGGHASLLGQDARRDHARLMQRVGYVPESPDLYDWMQVRELLRFTSRFYRHWNSSLVGSLLQRFGVDPQQRVRHLSRGTQAQVALALAMGHDPELLILDEPATGLDVLVRRNFLESIIQIVQQEGRSVLFSSHLVHEVERVADQIVVIDSGQLLVSARTEELKQEAGQSLEEIFVNLVGGAHAAEVRS